jgi:hypothetical protein
MTKAVLEAESGGEAATSLAGPSRSSRAISDACRLAGTANAGGGTAAVVRSASSSRASRTLPWSRQRRARLMEARGVPRILLVVGVRRPVHAQNTAAPLPHPADAPKSQAGSQQYQENLFRACGGTPCRNSKPAASYLFKLGNASVQRTSQLAQKGAVGRILNECVCSGLRVVYGGVRYARSEGGEGAARRVGGVIRVAS